MRKSIISIASVASLCLLVSLLNITTPTSAGPFGILAIFLFLFIFIFGVSSLFIFCLSYLLSHLSGVMVLKRPLHAISFRRASYYATIMATAVVMLVGLQSVGKVGIYEYILVTIFIFIGCIYIHKKVS